MEKKSRNLFSGIAFALTVALIVSVLSAFEQRVIDENAQIIEKNIRQAAIYCYAVEGAYPQDIEYLKRYYGLTTDDEKYYISYESFGSNIMPDIVVVKKGTYYFDGKEGR